MPFANTSDFEILVIYFLFRRIILEVGFLSIVYVFFLTRSILEVDFKINAYFISEMCLKYILSKLSILFLLKRRCRLFKKKETFNTDVFIFKFNQVNLSYSFQFDVCIFVQT